MSWVNEPHVWPPKRHSVPFGLCMELYMYCDLCGAWARVKPKCDLDVYVQFSCDGHSFPTRVYPAWVAPVRIWHWTKWLQCLIIIVNNEHLIRRPCTNQYQFWIMIKKTGLMYLINSLHYKVSFQITSLKT